MLKKLKIGLIVLILFKLACVKIPVSDSGEFYSSLFKMSAKVEGNNVNSLRLYITSDCKDFFAINILLPTNRLVLRANYDGKKLVIVDYGNKIAYIDNKKPFDLKRVMGYSLNIGDFVDFFNRCYLKKQCNKKSADGTKMIVNDVGQIVIMGKFGNILLKPVGKTVKGKIESTEITVPKGFKVIYERD